ncbi:MAG: hypothetical protein AB8G86_23215 [Saprospiraceae bacterium]
MIQRDIIQQQIEQLGRALGKVITGFLGLKSQGKVALGFEIANEQFKQELDIDIDQLLKMDKALLTDYLKDKPFTSTHLDEIAGYVEVLGDHQSDTAAKTNAFGTALNLMELANEQSDVFDMNRQFKLKAIEQKIKDLN